MYQNPLRNYLICISRPSPRDSVWAGLEWEPGIGIFKKTHPSDFDESERPDVEKYGREVRVLPSLCDSTVTIFF